MEQPVFCTTIKKSYLILYTPLIFFFFYIINSVNSKKTKLPLPYEIVGFKIETFNKNLGILHLNKNAK